jgi:hypothetical protein
MTGIVRLGKNAKWQWENTANFRRQWLGCYKRNYIEKNLTFAAFKDA